jgi:fatty acid desaturase
MDSAPATPLIQGAPPRLEPGLARVLHEPDHRRHYQRLAVFVLLYLGAAFAVWSLAICPSFAHWRWLVALPCYLCAAGALHGISLFAHEAVHQTLARNGRWNALLGAACAIPVLQNCSAYTVLHLRHHQHLGEDGDPDHYAAYTRWTWLIFTMNWFRLLIGYPIYIVAIPILGWRHGTARQRVGIALEFAAAVLLVTAALLAPLPAGLLLHGWLIPMLLINFMVNIRGMSQHTLLGESTDEVRGTRSILTSRLIAFFMCNENYHLEHHLYPGVPWYHLPRVHAALRGELIARGAPYIRSYTAFVREFIVHSLRRSPLGRHRNLS